MTLPSRRGFVTVVAVVSLVVLAGLAWAYRVNIVTQPGDHLAREHIRSVIAQESPVLFSDGETRIGVFFAREHRTYVPFDEIPSAWVTAIVAAEDQRFWDHHGVDPFGIARAMLANIRAGRMVAGGSTLTQQTAKNLYYRPDRSLGSKWVELLNAMRLESHYTKKEILEFYANQFHVSSNGRGLGIAARYFFDKEVSELGTLECAFLAGLVKAPARYNPFIGRTAEARAEARERARLRTRYVLDRMRDEGALTPSVHAELVAAPIPFQKGRFQYESNVVLDEVEARLSAAPFPALFESLNIDNPSTAGISIVTTLHEAAQRGGTYGLWHHLTEVGGVMDGVDASSFALDSDTRIGFDPSRVMKARTFHTARGIASGGSELQLPNGVCTVDREAIKRASDIIARARGGNLWARGTSEDVAAIETLIASGKPLMVSLRGQTDEGWVCDLERRPELQGALMVLEGGQIRAMVGGNDNRNFNRAIHAKRQLGSVWKPMLYNAALQLGWAPTDAVDNRSNVFHFEGTWYYPRADHENEDWVSLGWLGTRSENLGSIWLLMHLTDKLGPRQFKLLADAVGLTRGDNEEWMAYIRRIRDDEGVISTESRLNSMAFMAAKLELVEELGGSSVEARALQGLFYGRDLEAEQDRVRRSGTRVDERLRALRRSYRGLAKAGTPCIPALTALQDSIRTAQEDALDTWDVGPLDAPDMTEFAVLRVSEDEERLLCTADGASSRALEVVDWLDWVRELRPMPTPSSVRVDDELSLGTLSRLHQSITRRLLVWGSADPYDWTLLQYHPDMRTLVGLRYMALLAKTYGVQESLPPVLSMPLGAVDISLEEAATMYQGMMDGQVWRFPGTSVGGPTASPHHPTQLISEIRDAAGRVLYRASPVPKPKADPGPGYLVGDILRNVVRWGTGRRALGAVTIGEAVVPVAGKTGTTNGYRNAAFAGFVPKASETGWHWAEGYTIVSYVGNDDNTPMRRRSVRLQGSNGALPAWLGTAQAMADAGLLGVPPVNEPEWTVPEGYQQVPVAEGTGLPLAVAPEEPGRTVLVEGQGAPVRRFAPVGLAEPTSAALMRIGPERSDGSSGDTGLTAP